MKFGVVALVAVAGILGVLAEKKMEHNQDLEMAKLGYVQERVAGGFGRLVWVKVERGAE